MPNLFNAPYKDLSTSEYEILLEKCKALPPPRGNYAIQSFVSNIILTVLDYQLHNSIVNKAHERFIRNHSDIKTIYDLSRFLSHYPDDKQGNTDAAITLWGYKHWTRLNQLRGLVSYFLSIDVTDADTLRSWATQAEFKKDFKGKVKGLGPAIFQWLIMRAGVETIKPDVHITSFVSTTIGYEPEFNSIIQALEKISFAIGRSPRELDLAIWELQRGGPGEI